MDVNKHIVELLYNHNCVILPGFGGLIANYKPASIHPSQHLFQPPSKSVAFNRSLQNNDGLLINHISVSEKLEFGAAQELVKKFVRKIEDSLSNKGSFNLVGIGELYLDIEKNLQFKQGADTNFLLASYGLDHFISEPVLRPENLLNINHQLPNKRKIKSSNKSFKWIWVVVILLLIMALIQILSWEGILPKVDLRKIGLSVLPSIESQSTVNPSVSKKDTVVHLIVFQNQAIQKSEPKTDTVYITESIAGHQEKNLNSPSYYIVLGCYHDSLSSVPFTQTCLQKNIPLIQIPVNKKYFRIGVACFENKETGIQQMNALKDSTGFDAWLMKAD